MRRKTIKPRQARKGAAVYGISGAAGALDLLQGVVFFGGAQMPADLEFSGYLAPSVHWGEGDKLFLQPVYLVPVEVFTTGLLSRPEYKTIMVMVEAVGGRVSIIPLKKTPAVLDGEPEGRRLPVNITLVSAVLGAESAAISEGREGWRALARSSHVMAKESQARICWKVWIRNGESLLDTVTGRSFPVGELLGLFLPKDDAV